MLKVKYNDNSTENIPMTSSGVTTSGFNNSNVGKVKVTVTYKQKTADYEIEIEADNSGNKGEEEEKVENSNLSNIKCDVKSIKAYYYTDNLKKEYILIDVEINQIIKALKNDKIEYYYYLSSNKNEQNINNWIKINEEQNDNNKLKFTVNSKDISNYNELSNEETVYIYVKEVAVKGGNQGITISKAMELEANDNLEIYVDDVKTGKLPTNNPGTTTKPVDQTIKDGKIPNAGIKMTVIISIIIIVSVGSFGYIRYKNLSKYIK